MYSPSSAGATLRERPDHADARVLRAARHQQIAREKKRRARPPATATLPRRLKGEERAAMTFASALPTMVSRYSRRIPSRRRAVPKTDDSRPTAAIPASLMTGWGSTEPRAGDCSLAYGLRPDAAASGSVPGAAARPDAAARRGAALGPEPDAAERRPSGRQPSSSGRRA